MKEREKCKLRDSKARRRQQGVRRGRRRCVYGQACARCLRLVFTLATRSSRRRLLECASNMRAATGSACFAPLRCKQHGAQPRARTRALPPSCPLRCTPSHMQRAPARRSRRVRVACRSGDPHHLTTPRRVQPRKLHKAQSSRAYAVCSAGSRTPIYARDAQASNGNAHPEQNVRDVPVASIRRPLAMTRANDQEKVAWLMQSISEIGLQEPIDVLEVRRSVALLTTKLPQVLTPSARRLMGRSTGSAAATASRRTLSSGCQRSAAACARRRSRR